MFKLRTVLILSGLILIFFFGEIALTFSEKGNTYLIEDNEVAFSLKLKNSYSDFESTQVIDNSVRDFIHKWKIKGASVAISKDEELVYAKGFGYASSEQKEEVKPGHLFRVASVSKLITAAAVMKLIEEDKIGLDDYVFGPTGILDTSHFNSYKDKRYEEVTVRHLLNHTAGWSRTNGDPMFNALYIKKRMKVKDELTLDNIIEYALSKRLIYTPGKNYSYSNLGYAILGRIIEEVERMPYEDFVILKVLKPAGIHDMHIGKSFQYEKFPNEVNYYSTSSSMKTYAFNGSGKKVPYQYGGNSLELLGAAGGWVASAPELCKLLSVMDGFDKQRDILNKETLELMIDPERAGKGLFGWRGTDDYGTWWRTGYLSGSTAMVVRQGDGINWVILLNTSTYKQSRIQRYISAMMFRAIYSVDIWPYLDLFRIDQDYPSPLVDIPESNPML